jgi:TRAP-type uncharacterized transport system substrate-binding protein
MPNFNRSAFYLVSTLIFLVLLISTGCEPKKDFTIISDQELGQSIENNSTVSSLQRALHPQGITLTFQNKTVAREADIIQLVHDGKVDIGIVKNDVDVHGGFTNVRTLLPLFPDVMLILCRQDPGKTDLQKLFREKKAAMVIDKVEEQSVMELFLRKNGALHQRLGKVQASDSTAITDALNDYDVIMLFASLNSPNVRNILRIWNGSIYSVDNPALMGQGSIVDGFCMAYPKALPFIIPKGTYGAWPKEPVLTFAVYDVLVCNKNLDSHIAYDILKNIYDMRPTLAEENFEFGMLDDNLESHKFSFPLHDGASQYMTRNEPTFWERESELIGLIITIVVLFSGGITTLIKYLKQRRKDRVDIYYNKVLFVSQRARDVNDLAQKETYLKELFVIRDSAFQQLIAETLDANDAFVIFVNLANSAIYELEQEIKELKKTQVG